MWIIKSAIYRLKIKDEEKGYNSVSPGLYKSHQFSKYDHLLYAYWKDCRDCHLNPAAGVIKDWGQIKDVKMAPYKNEIQYLSHIIKAVPHHLTIFSKWRKNNYDIMKNSI